MRRSRSPKPTGDGRCTALSRGPDRATHARWRRGLRRGSGRAGCGPARRRRGRVCGGSAARRGGCARRGRAARRGRVRRDRAQLPRGRGVPRGRGRGRGHGRARHAPGAVARCRSAVAGRAGPFAPVPEGRASGSCTPGRVGDGLRVRRRVRSACGSGARGRVPAGTASRPRRPGCGGRGCDVRAPCRAAAAPACWALRAFRPARSTAARWWESSSVWKSAAASEARGLRSLLSLRPGSERWWWGRYRPCGPGARVAGGRPPGSGLRRRRCDASRRQRASAWKTSAVRRSAGASACPWAKRARRARRLSRAGATRNGSWDLWRPKGYAAGRSRAAGQSRSRPARGRRAARPPDER